MTRSLHRKQFLNAGTTNNNLPAINKLNFETANRTERGPTKALTPNQGPVFIRSEELGSGTYGVVYRVWDAITGIVYAAKELKEGGLRFWEVEKDILERISHVVGKSVFLVEYANNISLGECSNARHSNHHVN